MVLLVSGKKAAVGCEAVVVEIILGVEDHAVAGAYFGGEFFRQDFGDDDVRADGDDFLLQRGGDAGGVAAGGDDYVLRAQRSAGGGDFPAARAFALDLIDVSVLEDGGTGAIGSSGQ